MKDFFQYLALGLLGLLLSLALPGLPVAWPALVWTSAYLGMAKKGHAWLLLPCLAILFSAFSLASAWELALPLAAASLVLTALRRNFALTPAATRAWLLAGCLLGQVLLGAALAAGQGHGWVWAGSDLVGFVATFFTGLVLLPFLGRGTRRFFRRLAALGFPARQVDLSRADWFGDRGGRLARKPFGLEKGL